MTGAGTSAPPTAGAAPRSGLPRWPLAIGFGVPLALIVLAASPLGPNPLYVLIGIPALLLIWVVAGARALIAGVRSAMRRDWRQCALASALPIVLLAVALNPFGFVRAGNYVGDVLHFVVARPYYDRRIAALPADDRPRLVVFDWGGMVWASTGLVYDESDQVALPAGSQSADWLAAASHSELSCEGYGADPFGVTIIWRVSPAETPSCSR